MTSVTARPSIPARDRVQQARPVTPSRVDASASLQRSIKRGPLSTSSTPHRAPNHPPSPSLGDAVPPYSWTGTDSWSCAGTARSQPPLRRRARRRTGTPFGLRSRRRRVRCPRGCPHRPVGGTGPAASSLFDSKSGSFHATFAAF